MSAHAPRWVPLWGRAFWLTLLCNAVWINASEVFRFFAFVMPMMRDAFPQIENVAPMNLPVFAIWAVWDTALVFAVTGFVWISLDRFGEGVRNAALAGACAWLGIFVILWLGLYNMNLAPANVLAIALPLSLVELVIAGLIVNWGRGKFG
ncbi:MAG: hypothetical protein AAF417_21060 [Pseudomonadota bacterium]